MLYMTLIDLDLMKSATIHKIHLEGELRRRLLDLGFASGVSVTPLFRSPLGDPTAYQVLNSVIALRKEDASQIEIIPISEEAQE